MSARTGTDDSAFNLTRDQLCDIAGALEGCIRQGLDREGAPVQCLPSFLPVGDRVPAGLVYVLDLGGSNLRAALARVGSRRIRLIKGPLGMAMPWQRGTPLAPERFFQVQADLLRQLACPAALPLGYCFSYPAVCTADRDAILMAWTKEIEVPGMVGRRVGEMLLAHLHQRGVACRDVTVINDTVAALLAGRIGHGAGVHIGLVVGTGTNMAALIPTRQIAKLASSGRQDLLPVNLESGNFFPPHLTDVDRALDETSSNPGRQRFEKAVAGAYLGRLFALAHPQAQGEPDTGTAGLMAVMTPCRGMDPHLAETAWRLYRRSALLTGAALAGLISVLTAPSPSALVRITAEGALMWSQPLGRPSYARIAGGALRQVLRHRGRPGLHVRIARRTEANLKGSALAALCR